MSVATDHLTVDALINKAIAEEGELVYGVVAAKIQARMAEQAPDELDAWLHERAVMFIAEEIRSRCRRDRNIKRARAESRAFSDAATRAEEGDYEPLGHFGVRFCVSDDNVHLTVGEMCGQHHAFVSSSYAASGKRDLMLSAFHAAVAKKVGDRRTSEVFTEEQYDELLRSMSKR